MNTGSTKSLSSRLTPVKQDADYVFYEFTRSICPECRRMLDAKILLRDNKVYLRKRCPDHGIFMDGHPVAPAASSWRIRALT